MQHERTGRDLAPLRSAPARPGTRHADDRRSPPRPGMRRRLLLLSGWIAAVLPGCAVVGRDYHAPRPDLPPAFPGAGEARAPGTAHPLAAWWTSFGDRHLDDLVARGLAANHDLRLALARLDESRAMLGIADAALGPTVDAQAGVTRSAMSHYGPIPFYVPPLTLWQAGFDASWEIDLWGAVRRGHEVALGELAAASWDAVDVADAVVAEIARAYLGLQAAAERGRLAEELVAATAATRALAERRQQDGLGTVTEVAEAAGAEARATAQRAPLAAEEARQRYRLAVLLGLDPGALDAELAEPLPLPGVPVELEHGVPADLLRRRPDLRAAERRLASATAQVGVAEADLFPRLSLDGSFGVQSTSTGTLFSKDAVMWSVGPAVRWRLLDWGRVRSGIRAADARVAEAMIAYDAALRRAEEDVATQLDGFAADRRRHAAVQAALGQALVGERAARDLRARGLTGDRQVLAAVQERLAAADLVAGARQALAEDAVALAKALGGGWDPESAPVAPPPPPPPPAATPAPAADLAAARGTTP